MKNLSETIEVSALTASWGILFKKYLTKKNLAKLGLNKKEIKLFLHFLQGNIYEKAFQKSQTKISNLIDHVCERIKTQVVLINNFDFYENICFTFAGDSGTLEGVSEKLKYFFSIILKTKGHINTKLEIDDKYSKQNPEIYLILIKKGFIQFNDLPEDTQEYFINTKEDEIFLLIEQKIIKFSYISNQLKNKLLQNTDKIFQFIEKKIILIFELSYEMQKMLLQKHKSKIFELIEKDIIYIYNLNDQIRIDLVKKDFDQISQWLENEQIFLFQFPQEARIILINKKLDYFLTKFRKNVIKTSIILFIIEKRKKQENYEEFISQEMYDLFDENELENKITQFYKNAMYVYVMLLIQKMKSKQKK